MGLFDKAKKLLKSDAADKVLSSDKLEELSDAGLDSVAGAAEEHLGAEHADKIGKARDVIDGKLGNE